MSAGLPADQLCRLIEEVADPFYNRPQTASPKGRLRPAARIRAPKGHRGRNLGWRPHLLHHRRRRRSDRCGQRSWFSWDAQISCEVSFRPPGVSRTLGPLHSFILTFRQERPRGSDSSVSQHTSLFQAFRLSRLLSERLLPTCCSTTSGPAVPGPVPVPGPLVPGSLSTHVYCWMQNHLLWIRALRTHFHKGSHARQRARQRHGTIASL